MQSLRNLTKEHHDIRRLLEALEQCSEQLSDGDTATRSQLVQLAQAMAILLDEVHFEKEEQILLPALARTGCDWESETFRQTRDEHERDRHLLASLRHAVACSHRWGEPERRTISANTGELVASQTRLIDKQDEQLYPMVHQRLGWADAATLEAQLESFDAGLDPARVRAARRVVTSVQEQRHPTPDGVGKPSSNLAPNSGHPGG